MAPEDGVNRWVCRNTEYPVLPSRVTMSSMFNSEKYLILVLVVAVVAILGWVVWRKKATSIPTNPEEIAVVKENPTEVAEHNSNLQEASPSGEVKEIPTPTELVIEDLVVGNGAAVVSGDTVTVNYAGTLLSGAPFDNSYDRGQPFSTKIGVGQVIEGWDKGIVGMKVGGKRRLVIPSNLAYGEVSPSPAIPAGSALVFEIELLEITK